ncbi:hypothetical protein RBA06_21975, partial [Mycobacteroides abscessus subsp. abscessus]
MSWTEFENRSAIAAIRSSPSDFPKPCGPVGAAGLDRLVLGHAERPLHHQSWTMAPLNPSTAARAVVDPDLCPPALV